jgi:hypothetical protein
LHLALSLGLRCALLVHVMKLLLIASTRSG